MLNRASMLWLAPFIVAALASVASDSPLKKKETVPDVVQFNRDVRPILSDNCFACHGLDVKTRKVELRLDTLAGATEKREDGYPLVPGDPKKSLVWQRIITPDSDEVMPPPKSHKKLTDGQKAILQKWIKQGGKYEQHWSFETLVQPEMPSKKVKGGNGIDAFIQAELKRSNVKGGGKEADKETLIRRVAFTLTGLPPTIAETDAYLADSSADAYERMVDKYLASPHYGEEMARHWLDLARYADTHGMHLDNERQTWAYRDWVIKAFNDNKRYDAFTIEQLAGDLLPNPTKEQLTATGFNRCNVTTSEGGSIDAELRYRYAVDRAATTMQAWLGLTGGCAQCHDHKFDPISQREFYSMYAFFNSAADPGFDGNALLTAPTVKLSSPEQDKKLAELATLIAEKQKVLDEKTAAVTYTDPATVEPKPPAEVKETVWFDDDFPAGAKVQATGHPLQWINAGGSEPVQAGKRALKRSDKALGQDFFDSGAQPLVLPPEAKFFVHVYLDPKDPPKAVMLQFNKGGWEHRAVWGPIEAIAYGAVNTPARHSAGALPEAGKWMRLEVPADKVGFKAGDALNGFAFTMSGGTLYWDNFGVSGRVDPAADPNRSLQAWWTAHKGKDIPGAPRKNRPNLGTPEIPPDLNNLVKEGPKKEHKPEQIKKVRDYYLQYVCVDTEPQLDKFTDDLQAVRKERNDLDVAIPSSFIFKDMPQPRESFVMVRGQYDKPAEKVEAATPAFLPSLKKAKPDGPANRLDLANWIVAPENPLTARVAVNRFWQQIFGRGLVKTAGDFGSQGEPPTHPEMLDWLAMEFRENGWDIKALVKLMLTSATFRQSPRVTPDLAKRDAENRFLARGPRFRLDAEQIRDNALYVSGLINLELGGKGVRTYQPPNIWEPVGFAGSNTRMYKADSGPSLYRRSIYTFFKRTAPAPFFSNFDAPNREQSCTGRERSNTPLQALQLMNDVQHVEAARGLAQRILLEGGRTFGERLTFAFKTVLSRRPDAHETAILQQELDAHLSRYTQDVEAAKKLIAAGESKPNPELNPSELAAYTLVASTLMNLDETLNRN